MVEHQANPQNSYAEKPTKKFKGKPFQVLGFDILVDKKMKCWILEINDHPSFNIVMCKEPKGNDCKHEICPLSRVDQYVKKRVFNDVLDLVIKSRKTPLEDVCGDTYGSLQRVFPFSRAETKEAHAKIKYMRDFFYHMGGKKSNYSTLSSTQWEMLQKNKFLKGCDI